MKKLKYFFVFMNFILHGLFAEVNSLEAAQEVGPKVKGPYSQAVQAGQFIFVSGQFAIDPTINELVGNTIEQQTAQALNNIESILKTYGLTLENVIKAEIYLKNLDDLIGLNSVYATRFSYPIKPARQTMQVVKLPLDALVEISCIAFIPGN